MNSLKLGIMTFALMLSQALWAQDVNEIKEVKLVKFDTHIDETTVKPELCNNRPGENYHCSAILLRNAAGVDAEGRQIELGNLVLVAANIRDGLMNMSPGDALMALVLAFTPKSEWGGLEGIVQSVTVSNLQYVTVKLDKVTAQEEGLGQVGRMTINFNFEPDAPNDLTDGFAKVEYGTGFDLRTIGTR